MSAGDNQSQPTVVDYVVVVLSPALIMGLVGSLVFFLLEVLYAGEYEARLKWILFFFVFGSVLIARMSTMTDIGARAGTYGAVLGFLVWLALQIYVEYPSGSVGEHLGFFFNAVLLGVTWWCAHRLTWDCTHITEETDVTGEGLLQAAGFDGESVDAEPPAEETSTSTDTTRKPAGWWQRWQRYREEKQKRRTPGVWVVYFSLGALPIFGLGQSLIPADAEERRRYTFWLMSVYVGCGLGLLMTTCFLGLRRYLRQRKLRMPVAMTGIWLTVGTFLIGLLLAAGALLPRPQGEYTAFAFGRAGSEKRSASKGAFKEDSPGEGEGKGGAEARDEQENPQKGEGDGKGEGEEPNGKEQGEKGAGQQQGSGAQEKGNNGQNRDPGKSTDQGAKNQGQGQEENKGRQGGGSRAGSSSKSRSGRDGKTKSSSSSSGVTGKMAEVARRIAPVLKWIVFVLIGLVTLYFVLRSGLQFLAGFFDWPRRLLAALSGFWKMFGGKREEVYEDLELIEEEPEVPFTAFRNPFTTPGKRPSAHELIRYTFTAMQAWARERELARLPGETPLEYADRLGQEVPALEADLQRLTALYVRSVYAPGGLPANTLQVLEQFWQRLEAVAEQPLSA